MEEIKKSGLTLVEAQKIANAYITDVKNGFIGTGFSLKIIRDEKLWQEKYDSFDAFMSAEYEKDKSWASKCISVYEKFGETWQPGGLPRLAEAYAGYNVGQLIELVSLPEEKWEDVTHETTIREIREMKPKRNKKVATVETFAETGETNQEPLSAYGTPKTVRPEGSLISTPDCEGGQCQFVDNSLAKHTTAEKEPVPCRHECQEPEWQGEDEKLCPPNNSNCRRQEWGTTPEERKRGEEECKKCWKDAKALQAATEEPEEPPEVVTQEPEETVVIDAEYVAVPEEFDGEYSLDYFLQEQKQMLKETLEAFKDCESDEVPRKLLERQKCIVAALAAMKADLDIEELKETYKPEQPRLPILKNNDQRATFVDAYETWPLWIETQETGERYYRYDLEDGTSMVVKVYQAMLFDGYQFQDGTYKGIYREGYGKQEYYLLREGKSFRDCDVNRTYLIDKLKEIQKKG